MLRAEGDCTDSGLATMNQCSSFITAIKQQTSDINSLPCATIAARINSGSYGTPSSLCAQRCALSWAAPTSRQNWSVIVPDLARRCCSSASAFFGSNCQNDNFIYAQATGPFGFTDASLKAGESP
jgi:hypothetical protein